VSETAADLRRKIESAGDLQSVVRTMKALAASSIGQYEESVRALGDYTRTVELGLSVSFRMSEPAAVPAKRKGRDHAGTVGAVVFGSDQGLVGRFNEVVADHAIEALARLGGRPRVWAVGERVHARLADAGLSPVGLFAVPSSVQAITPLIGRILLESEARPGGKGPTRFICSTIATTSDRFSSRSVSGCCLWMKPGAAGSPAFGGRRSICPKFWEGGSRP
jgi:F-type H+-transporting ATPase subunit gamma